MKTRFLRTTAACCTVAAALLFAGCNTVEGVGQDVEAAGEGIEDAAD